MRVPNNWKFLTSGFLDVLKMLNLQLVIIIYAKNALVLMRTTV